MSAPRRDGRRFGAGLAAAAVVAASLHLPFLSGSGFHLKCARPEKACGGSFS